MERTKLLILRVTERCNLACGYCYAASGADKGDMSLDTAMKSVALFAKSGDRLKIQFTGGEPLLRADLMRDISIRLKREGIRAAFSVQTNGTLLNQESCSLLREMRCAFTGTGQARSAIRSRGSGRLRTAACGAT